MNTIKSIGIMDPNHSDLRILYHSLLNATFPGPRLEATEDYRSTIMLLSKDGYLEAAAENKSGFAKAGQDKFNPKYWKKVEPKNEWYVKGASLYASEKYNDIECFDRALETDHNDIDALNLKGLSLEHLTKHEQAIECFDKALEINPSDIDSNEFKSLALGRMKE